MPLFELRKQIFQDCIAPLQNIVVPIPDDLESLVAAGAPTVADFEL